MEATQVLGLISTILALIIGLEFRVQKIVKTYLKELIPNGGSSMKDQLNRLEQRQHEIYVHFMNKDI
jgi:hypothetical protein